MGRAVPMPVVVKTRTYDTAFYAAIQSRAMQSRAAGAQAEDPEEMLALGRAVLRGEEDAEEI